MAEGIARLLQQQGKLPADLFFASAGVAALDGEPMSDETRVVLGKLGIELDGAAKRLTPAMVQKADLVLGMTRSHVGAARSLVAARVGAGDESATEQKVQPLDPGADIPDPIGSAQSAYDAVGRRLLELIPKRVKEMLPS